MRRRIKPPTTVSFSPDSNIVGDGVADANVLTLNGLAIAGSTVSVLDAAKLLGTTTADTNGAWAFTTGALEDGAHEFTALVSLGGDTSPESSPPVVAGVTTFGSNQAILSGTAEADSKGTIYEGTEPLGTTKANDGGTWSFLTGPLPGGGVQEFTATAMDAAGNISQFSRPVEQNVGMTEVVTATASSGNTMDAPVTAALHSTSMVAPSPSTIQNYSRLVFDDEFGSYSTIDMSNSQSAGFNWYLANWFSHGASANNNSNVTISNGVLKLGGGTGTAEIVSAFDNSIGGFTGSIFGNGGYFEASIRFDPSAGANATLWPAFWGMSIEHEVDSSATGASRWPGQPSGYSHFAEVDILEYMQGVGLNSTQYLGTMHDWSGTYSTSTGWQYNIANYGSSYISVGPIDWNAFHTYGLLWVPQSGSTAGHVTWYFDGHPMSSIYWLGPPVSTSLPGINGGSFTPSSIEQASTTYSILDSQHLALSLTADPNWPMYVDWVRVWQSGSAPAAGNTAVISQDIDPTTGSGVTINATNNADTIDATHGVNGVVPTNGNDTISTLAGNDTISGLGGNDVLKGGSGSDTFVFGSNFGRDIITDFQATGSGHDVLQFSQNTFSDFAAVLAHATQVGTDVVIAADTGDTVTLQNVLISSLQKNDVHIV